VKKTIDKQVNIDGVKIRPFLRWAGGKQRIVNFLLPFVPNKNIFKNYYEPFLGGGALFFTIQPKNALISDINSELIYCYQQVKKDPESVFCFLRKYARNDSPVFFYKVRAMPVHDMAPQDRAARFIYLNKAAFNGIYRVNKTGDFNVPYGPSFNGPAIPSKEVLMLGAKCLRKAKILAGDFEEILADASADDFVYLDPPYPPRSDTAFFTHYSADRFGWEEQVRVAKMFSELSSRGCLVMLSNAYQKKIVNLYEQFHIFRLNVIRWLGSNGDRFKVREIVVTNYNPAEVT